MEIKTLYEEGNFTESLLTPELERLYGGALSFPRKAAQPYVIGNFVETLDGVVSYLIPGKSGGGPISNFSNEDHFVMGLLRSVVDAVLVGSGTLHGDPGHVRIPELIYPEAQELYANLRKKLGKPPLPLNVILTASGRVDLNEPTFHTEGLQSIIVTTNEGASRLSVYNLPTTTIRSTGESGSTTPRAILKILADEFGVRLLLHEGGPTVFGKFMSAECVDELFLTLAPQVAGRKKGAPRPSFAGETSFLPKTAPWMKLKSTKQGSDHLFLRYAFQRP